MKVLFIYPNLSARASFNVGIAFLSAALKEAGHKTALISLDDRLAPLPTDDELLQAVNSAKPGLVAFSVEPSQLEYATSVARKVRRAFPHVPLLVGGAQATLAPKSSLETGVFDYACVVEGEEAIVELAAALASGGDAAGIRNIWARVDGRIAANPVRPPADLDRLPPKDYGLFDFQRIIDTDAGRVSLVTSRGCPLRNPDCLQERMLAIYARDTGIAAKDLRRVRYHSVDSVMDEIEHLTSGYKGIRLFAIEDEIFTFEKRRLKEFVSRYKATTDVPFSCNTHPRFFDAATAKLLAEGGCRLVTFCVGSGSPRVREEVLHRAITDDELEAAFAAARAAGLETAATVELGLPTEMKIELDQTVYLLSRLKPGRVRWSLSAPLPAPETADGEAPLDLDDAPNASDGGYEASSSPDGRLRIAKLNAAFAWYLNAEGSDTHVRRLYSRLTAVIDNLGEADFADFRPQIQRFDDLMHQVLAKAGREHYCLLSGESAAVASSWKI